MSNLLKGRISQVNIETLLRYADRLHLQTSIAVRPIEARRRTPPHLPQSYLPSTSSKKEQSKADAEFKAEQDKCRREGALAQATGLRVLTPIGEAVPVRLMKCDLLFMVERLASTLDENRLIKQQYCYSLLKLNCLC